MSSVIFVPYIAIDDEDLGDGRPFGRNPAVWSLKEDYALSTCGNERLFAALGFDPRKNHPEPLFPLRGLPTFIASSSELHQLYDEEHPIGWLNAIDLQAAFSSSGINYDGLESPLKH